MQMNNLENVLKYVDDLVTLTPIQEAILKGTYQGKKNFQIAQDFNCSESHIKKEAAKLWKKLGEELGENINKHNVSSKLAKKYRVSQFSKFGHCLQVDEGNINVCDKTLQVTDKTEVRSNSPQTENELPIIDLTEAPEINYNYERIQEINTLKEWLENKTKLITIYGLKGIGKTALILKLIFEQIANKNHQSSVILISQEKSPDIEILENNNNHVKTLKLEGLKESAQEILKEKGLKNEEKWEKLIALYQTHPTWLKIIAGTIEQLYNDDVTEFLNEENDLFIGDIKLYLQPHLDHLSELEKKVINWLTTQNQPVNITQISANLELSKSESGILIQSLLRRCLVEKVVNEDKFYYQLNNIFKKYLKPNK